MIIKKYVKEILYRLLLIIYSIIVNSFVICYYNQEVFFCLGQYQQTNIPSFLSTQLTEILNISIKTTSFFSIYFSYAYITYQCWTFLNPGLYKYESKYFTRYTTISILGYFTLTYILYNYILYIFWMFFEQFEFLDLNYPIKINTHIKLNENITLILEIIYGFFLYFNFVVIMLLFLSQFNIDIFITQRKIFYFVFFCLTILTNTNDFVWLIIIIVIQIICFEIYIIYLYINILYKFYRANNRI